MSIKIKREKFRGKFYVVARDNGKILDRKLYSKDFTVKKAKNIFRSNRTFERHIDRNRLTSSKWAKQRGYYIDEISDFETGKQNKHYEQYQYVVKGRLQDGREVFGRSNKYDSDFPLEEAKAEARRRFFSNLSSALSEDIYDEDKGIGLAVQLKENNAIKINEGFIYYARFQTSKTHEAEA